MTKISGKGRPIPMSWEYSRASRIYTDTHNPRDISQIAIQIKKLSQVCNKDRAKSTTMVYIKQGIFILFMRKQEIQNKYIIIIIWVYFKNDM